MREIAALTNSSQVNTKAKEPGVWMIGSLLLSDALTSKFFSVLFLGKLHVFLMCMCFPSEGCWDLGEVSRSKPK